MTTYKTGVDMVFIPRIKALLESDETRAPKMFSKGELEYSKHPDGNWNFERLAARFAAKEAVLKAMGTGFSNGLYLHDVSVGKRENGEPYVILSEKAQDIFKKQGGVYISISLTHENEYACAFVIATFDS